MSERTLSHDWFPAPLPTNVVLGEGSWLYSSYAFRHYQSREPIGLQVGCDTGLYDGTFFELGPRGNVQIGDYCSLVGVILASNGRVSIGDYALFAHEVVIAEHDYWVPHRAAGSGPKRPAVAAEHRVTIGENVWIGARANLIGNVAIGDNAVIGAAALVTEDVPANAIFAGNPGRVVGSVDRRDVGTPGR